LFEAFTRKGYALTRYPISLLLLGDLGWIQLATFVVTGLLVVGCAVGIWRALHPGRAATGAPLLVGLYGWALIIAGVFPPDPSFGFPAGAQDRVPALQSATSMVHELAVGVCALSIVAASIVFARRFTGLGQRGWAAYCIATAVSPLFLAAAMPTWMRGSGGLPVLGAAVIMFGWLALVANRLMADAGQCAR